MTHARSSTSSSKLNDQQPQDPARKYGFPLAAVMAVVALLVIEGGLVWKNRHYWWDANYILLEKKRDMLTSGGAPDDVAIFGSSRFYHVRPQIVKSIIGEDKKVTNYSWGWCGVETYEAMLRGLIQNDRKPRVLILDGYPEIYGYPGHLMSITSHDVSRVGFLQTTPKMAALRTVAGLKEWKTLWGCLTHYATPPTAANRAGLIAAGKKWLAGEGLALPRDYDLMVTSWEEQGWFLFTPPDRVAGTEEFLELEKHTGPYKEYDNGAIEHAYERVIRLAQKNDIRVILLPAPNNTYVYEKFTKHGVYLKYDRMLHKLEADYPNFTAPPPRWFAWPGTLGDSNHVNAAGAEKHLQVLTDLLREQNIAATFE